MFEAWTVHSFSGDYNPLHDHGVLTPGGLSMILYLQVPECISKLPDPDDRGGSIGLTITVVMLMDLHILFGI